MEPAAGDGDVGVSSAEDSIPTIERVEARPVTPPAQPSSEAGTRGATSAPRHISRDYSYVRAEVKRIVLVGGFLIISLIITALLRN